MYYKSISNMVTNILMNCYFFINSYLSINDKIENRTIKQQNEEHKIVDTVMDRDIYEIERNYYESNDCIEDRYIYASRSASIIIHRCGYCMQNVGTPTYRYNDNTFCDKYCRDKQINHDNKSLINRSNKSHSF